MDTGRLDNAGRPSPSPLLARKKRIRPGLNDFDFRPDFSFDKFVERMLGLSEQVCDSGKKSAKAYRIKVESGLTLRPDF